LGQRTRLDKAAPCCRTLRGKRRNRFDPLAHDGTLGEFLRVVYIRTNDPQMPEATQTIRVSAEQPWVELRVTADVQ
jgi:hypothetical protein